MIYKCAVCGGIFEEMRTEMERVAEMKANFGDAMTIEQCDVVCDSCYNEVKLAAYPYLFAKWKAEQ